MAGNYYKIRFYYSNHPSLGSNPSKMTLGWSGSPSEQFTANFATTKSNMNWQLVERTLPATSATTTLSFTSNTPQNQNYGVALDNVSVTPLQQQATLSVTVSHPPERMARRPRRRPAAAAARVP